MTRTILQFNEVVLRNRFDYVREMSTGRAGSKSLDRSRGSRICLMRQRATLLFILLVSIAPARSAPRPTVLIELFTSEGCSSCPAADALLQRLVEASPRSAADDVAVVALGEHVDYWNHQGWKDRFSSAALTNRQQLYAARFNVASIYTPQMVVDGRAALVGSDASAARRAIDRAAAAPHGVVRIAIEKPFPDLSVVVDVSELPAIGRGDRADILLAVTEDHLTSHVTRGENHGRVLSHVAVVRRLVTIGEANGPSASARAAVAIAPDWQRDHLKLVAFVQERRGRTILASAASSIGTMSRP